MSVNAIPKEQIDAIFPQVAQIVADAIGCEVTQVKPDASLIADLGAESIDFADIIFRLQRAFKVKIPRGKIIAEARGDLSESEFEQAGAISEAGMVRLRSFLSEVPADRFSGRLSAADIPRLFTVETFCKLVIRQQNAPAEPPKG
jgi:acyl carrier protein